MPAMTRYHGAAIAMHWLTAVLIVALFGLGLTMVELPFSPKKLQWYSWHKWMGVTVFLLATMRLLWRLYRPAPALPPEVPAWQRQVSAATHHLLYLLMFVVPVAGWLFSSAKGFQTVYLGILPLPDLIAKNEELASALKLFHKSSAMLLGALVVMHVAAAIKHHLVDRDTVLLRMLPFLRPPVR